MKTLFIGNLPYELKKKDLCKHLETLLPFPFVDLRIVLDRYSGRSKGYAFLDVDDKYYDVFVKCLKDEWYMGRQLVVGDGKQRQKKNNSSDYYQMLEGICLSNLW